MATTLFNIPQTVRDIFAELQRIRTEPTGDPPTRAGAAQLQDILGGRDRQGNTAPAVYAEWGARTINAIAATDGDNQGGFPDQGLAKDLTVRVTNAAGAGLDDVDVRFVVSDGDGRVTVHTVRTGSFTISGTANPIDGVATFPKNAWLLGPRGDNRLTAYAGNASVVFTARAATGMTPLSAIHQAGNVSKPVTEDPTVRISDHAGRPVPGVDVTFTVTAGGGKLGGNTGSKTVQTGADGSASSGKWTLGANPVANALVATAGPRLKQEFTAAAT